jgi:hypothetical protein
MYVARMSIADGKYLQRFLRPSLILTCLSIETGSGKAAALPGFVRASIATSFFESHSLRQSLAAK